MYIYRFSSGPKRTQFFGRVVKAMRQARHWQDLSSRPGGGSWNLFIFSFILFSNHRFLSASLFFSCSFLGWAGALSSCSGWAGATMAVDVLCAVAAMNSTGGSPRTATKLQPSCSPAAHLTWERIGCFMPLMGSGVTLAGRQLVAASRTPVDSECEMYSVCLEPGACTTCLRCGAGWG